MRSVDTEEMDCGSELRQILVSPLTGDVPFGDPTCPVPPRLEYHFAQALKALDSGPANLKNIRAEVSAIVIRPMFL